MSEESYPEKIKNCIESWKKVLPDYTIKLWNYKNFPRGKSKWVDEAFDSRKFAFVADYIRNYALYTEGGIYLDSDVEVKQSLDKFLELPYFLGKENGSNMIEAAVMGAEKGFKLFKEALDFYDNNNFINPDGSLNDRSMPYRLWDFSNNLGLKFKFINSVNEFGNDENTLFILREDYFSPKDNRTGTIHVTNNTHTIHHFSGSWLNKKSISYQFHILKNKLIKIFGTTIILKCANFIKQRR